MKTVLGMVAFGDHKYTKMALEPLITSGLSLVIVLTKGNIDNIDTWIMSRFGKGRVTFIMHDYNKGFPAGINDIMDEAFGRQEADQLIFLGNDTIAYPECIDRLIQAATEFPEFDFYTAREYNVRTFLERYPQFRSRFDSQLKYLEENFEGWKLNHRDAKVDAMEITAHQTEFINGFHNCALIRRSYFETVGYVDVGYYPAYYEDRDYVSRGFARGMKHAEVRSAIYFHFWSRVAQENNAMLARFYALNAMHFSDKWSGTAERPIERLPLPSLVQTPQGEKDIYGEFDRSMEDMVIQHWRWTPRNLRHRHPAQRCVIACNGPGLNDIDMDLLQDEIVFGLNRGYLKEGLPITYHVAVNPQVWAGLESEYKDLDVRAMFVPAGAEDLWTPKTFGLRFKADEDFEGNINNPIWQGHTVTYVAMQIAYFMGFKNVYLIGCDHNFPSAEGRPTNHPIQLDGPDPNHFDPNYFPVGFTWDTPNLGKSEKAYELARQAFEARGGELINCSTISALDILERRPLEEALNA